MFHPHSHLAGFPRGAFTGERSIAKQERTCLGIGGIFKARSSNLNLLAEETGGEVLTDKPENLDRTFNDLIDHLRTRYVVGFVSTNTKRDGSFRKLKLEVIPSLQKPDSKLVVKTRRGYIAARRRTT